MTPLYARLPRGPHRMKRDEVVENQRQRMHGAMVEAVAAQGYGGTSVKQVISLAGVSRRAFYEQFANKQECFLSTLELLSRRASEQVGAAYRSGGPTFEQRIDAGLRTLLELLAANPKCAHMTLLDAPAAGPSGRGALTKTLLGFERTLFESFERTPGAGVMPAGVVRGITGAIHMIAFKRIRQQRTTELPGHASDVRDWMLSAHSPLATRLLAGADPRPSFELLAARGEPRSAQQPADGGIAPSGAGEQELSGVRARVLESALEAIALEGYGNLSPLRIVDRAGVSIDTFFNLFGDMEDCALVALANLSEELRATVARVGSQYPGSWPLQVRCALHSLLSHLAANPSHARAIATGTFEMGPAGIDLSVDLADEIARTLIAGAPADRPAAGGALAGEAVAGAVWHTVYCHAVHNKTDMLPASADQLAYLVLAPFIGARQAVEALCHDSRPQHAIGGHARQSRTASRPPRPGAQRLRR